jgi:hypothetical protein
VCALLRALLRILQPGVLPVLLLHPVAHHVTDQGLARQDRAAYTQQRCSVISGAATSCGSGSN